MISQRLLRQYEVKISKNYYSGINVHYTVLLEVDRIDQGSNLGPLGNWDWITAKSHALAHRATETHCYTKKVRYSTVLAWCFCVNLSQKVDFCQF